VPKTYAVLARVLVSVSGIAAIINAITQLWLGRSENAVIPAAVLLLCAAVYAVLVYVDEAGRR
jgi:hypothetical protein